MRFPLVLIALWFPVTAHCAPHVPKTLATRAGDACDTGDNFYRNGAYIAALSSYRKAERLNPRKAYAYFGEGSALYYLGEPRKAVTALSIAIRLRPRFADAYFARACARAELKDMAGAIADDTQAITDAATATFPGNVSAAYIDRADLRYKLGDVQGALEDMNMGVQLDPNSPECYVSRCRLRRKLEDWEGAQADATHALSLYPRDADAFYERSWVRFTRRDYDGALSDINVALKGDTSGDPDYVSNLKERHSALSRYLVLRANIYAAQGDRVRAMIDNNHALRLNPHNASAYAARATLEASVGQSRTALADYREASALYKKQGDYAESDNIQSLIANLG